MPSKADHTHSFTSKKTMEKETNSSGQRTCLKKRTERKKNKDNERSMDAEERFHNKRMVYVKYCIHMRHNIPLSSISLNWTSKYVSVKGQIVVKRVKVDLSSTSNTKMLKTKLKNKCRNGKQKAHRNDCE